MLVGRNMNSKSVEEQRQELASLTEKISSKESKLNDAIKSEASLQEEVSKLMNDHEIRLNNIMGIKAKIEELQKLYDSEMAECCGFDSVIESKRNELTKCKNLISKTKTELKNLDAKASKLRETLDSEESKLLEVLKGITLSDIIQIQVNAVASEALENIGVEKESATELNTSSKAILHIGEIASDFHKDSKKEGVCV